MEMEKKNNQDKIGAKKFFAWQSRAVSSACCVVILGYLRIYCTDQLALSGTVIGIILLLSNVVDAVTDLTAGIWWTGRRAGWEKADPMNYVFWGYGSAHGCYTAARRHSILQSKSFGYSCCIFL